MPETAPPEAFEAWTGGASGSDAAEAGPAQPPLGASEAQLEEYKQALGWQQRERPIEVRSDEPRGWHSPEPRDGPRSLWIRARGELGDDPLLHACVLAYASDMSLVDTMYRPHRHPGPEDVMMASLDHAMWFHRAFRMDEWILYVQESPVAAGARGFARGAMYARDGAYICSVAQEGLIRKIDPARRG